MTNPYVLVGYICLLVLCYDLSALIQSFVKFDSPFNIVESSQGIQRSGLDNFRDIYGIYMSNVCAIKSSVNLITAFKHVFGV